MQKDGIKMSDNIKEKVLEAIEKADLYIRPYAIFCNPIIEDYLKQEFGKQYKVVGCQGIEKEKVYVIERKAFEESLKIKQMEFEFDSDLEYNSYKNYVYHIAPLKIASGLELFANKVVELKGE